MRRHLPIALLALACLGCPGGAEPGKDMQNARKLANEWQPPAKYEETGKYFPPDVAGYKLASEDIITALTEFDFDKPSRHAVYSSGAQQIDVFLYSGLTKDDMNSLQKGVEADHDKPGPEPKGLSYGAFWLYSSGLGKRYWFFNKNGWLVVLRSTKAVDQLPFAEEYLRGLK